MKAKLLFSAAAFFAVATAPLQAMFTPTPIDMVRCVAVAQLTALDKKTPPADAKHYSKQASALETLWREQETRNGKTKPSQDQALRLHTKMMQDGIKTQSRPGYDHLAVNMKLCKTMDLINGR